MGSAIGHLWAILPRSVARARSGTCSDAQTGIMAPINKVLMSGAPAPSDKKTAGHMAGGCSARGRRWIGVVGSYGSLIASGLDPTVTRRSRLPC
jgi:hypothetical protein